MLQNEILNLKKALSKKPKIIKIEEYKTLNTTIEPGNVKGYLDNERKLREEAEQKCRNLEDMLNKMNFLNS